LHIFFSPLHQIYARTRQAALLSLKMVTLMRTKKPKILIPEKVSPDGLALLKDEFDVDEKKGLSPEELKTIIGEYDALIVRSETKVTADLLSAAKNMKVVARAGVGVDNVDVQSATLHGIIVVNSPSGNINAAAEHTIACESVNGHELSYPLIQRSADGCRPECERCFTKHQGGQMGAQSACRGRGQRQDSCYRGLG
jgi:hypothetical protein